MRCLAGAGGVCFALGYPSTGWAHRAAAGGCLDADVARVDCSLWRAAPVVRSESWKGPSCTLARVEPALFVMVCKALIMGSVNFISSLRR